MEFRTVSAFAVLLVLGVGQGMALAQDSTGSVPLGDLARQLKARRPSSEQKAKVFTNDDLSAQPRETPKKEKASEKETPPAHTAEAAEGAHGEKYYRSRMAKLEDRLEIDRRELSVLEQKLGQNQVQYYADPNKGLLQESGPTALADVHKLQDQVAKKKAEVAADEEAIDNLREQLRRDGGDPGWLR